MRIFAVVFTVLTVLCYISAQEIPKNVEEAFAKVNEVINLSNITSLDDVKNINLSQTPLGDIENLFKKKCEKNGGPEAYEKAKQSILDLYQCGSGLVNITTLQMEMAEARPKGDLDEVFKKYCRKKPILKNCIFNFTNTVEPCLEAEEVKNQNIVKNVIEKVLNFTCFKDGDRIALFVAAKGPECIQTKAPAIIERCGKAINGTEANFPVNPADGLSALSQIKSLPSLIFDDKFCRNLAKFQTCTVTELETCEDPTPANLLDSIFNYIKRVTPCEKMLGDQPLPPQAQTMANGGTVLHVAVAAVSFAVYIAIFS